MKPSNVLALFLTSLLATIGVGRAQVPTVISYQGRIQSNGTNFTGNGRFKFAIVSPGTNTSRTATAAGTVNNGFLIGITVTDGGNGYTTAPAVTITDATGS